MQGSIATGSHFVSEPDTTEAAVIAEDSEGCRVAGSVSTVSGDVPCDDIAGLYDVYQGEFYAAKSGFLLVKIN